MEYCATCLYYKNRFGVRYCVAKNMLVNLFDSCIYYMPDYIKMRESKLCANTVMDNLQKI